MANKLREKTRLCCKSSWGRSGSWQVMLTSNAGEGEKNCWFLRGIKLKQLFVPFSENFYIKTVWWILAEMWLLWWGVCVARWCGGAIKWNGAKRLWGWFHQFTPKVASNRLRRPISEFFSSELRSQLAPVSMHLIGKGVCQISFWPTLHLSFGIVVRWQYVSFKLWSETSQEANCSLYCVQIFNSFLYKFKYLILAVI